MLKKHNKDYKMCKALLENNMMMSSIALVPASSSGLRAVPGQLGSTGLQDLRTDEIRGLDLV